MDDRPIIVGGGVAGLTAALHLAERGLTPLLLEADPEHCGGRVAGGDVIEWNGWRFRDEHAVHAIWSPYRNLQAMLARRAIRPMLVPAQEESWVYRRAGRVRAAAVGSLIRHSGEPPPFHYLALFLNPRFLAMLTLRDWLSLPLVWYGLLLALSLDPLGEWLPMEGMWLGDMVKHWSPALRAFFIGLARSGLSAHPEEIPLAGFIAFLRFYTLRRRDAWAFSYMPADGGTCLAEPLARCVRELGGVVDLGAQVSSLERTADGRWRVEVAGRAPRIAWQVILATDAPHTARLLAASPELAAAARDLHWPRGMPTGVVRLWFDRLPRPGPEAGIFSGDFAGDFAADNFFWLHRLQDPYVAWSKATGGSAMEVHIYGPPELLEESDAVLLARVIADVQSAFPELRGALLHPMIRRNPPTHTLVSLGPAGRHLGIETPWPGIFCCGDWVRHPAPAFFLERACVTGIAAANAVLRSRGLETWPLLDYLPAEPLAGAIERFMGMLRRSVRRLRRRRPTVA